MRDLQITTYNVRVDTDADKTWSWDYRKQEVLDLIRYHSWDVFGVQEIRPNQVKDLSELTEFASYTEEREGDNQGEGLGIYYKPDLFDCLDKGYFWLSETIDTPSIHPEAGCKRIALWVILKEKMSQKKVLIINTHLDHVSENARNEGMSVLLRELDEKIAEYPTIILGDFNSDRKEKFHDQLAETFIYPRDLDDVMSYGPKGTFQDFDYNALWDNLEEIDFVLFKELNCFKYGVLTDSCNQKFPSDHFPVVASFHI